MLMKYFGDARGPLAISVAGVPFRTVISSRPMKCARIIDEKQSALGFVASKYFIRTKKMIWRSGSGVILPTAGDHHQTDVHLDPLLIEHVIFQSAAYALIDRAMKRLRWQKKASHVVSSAAGLYS